jgi:hypothetical protein
MLKARPEIDRLHQKLCSPSGLFDFPAFERFMRDCQKVSTIQRLYALYLPVLVVALPRGAGKSIRQIYVGQRSI